MNDASKGKEGALLARIDERTTILLAKVGTLEDLIQTKYVTRDEFQPVKAVVYGLVGVICLAVVSALIALVVRGI